MQAPHYPYLEQLKRCHEAIDDLSLDFEGDRRCGLAMWKQNVYHIAYGCYEDFFYSRGVKKPSAIAIQQFIDDFESYSLCDDHGYYD